ncbi:NADP-dependent oxidoreductase [Catenulispora subtropica]|uniref:NADP-dependent oxidoreductase n=1 Tax=Catenulispora subtropica TaxID=450798 RepID=A0ABN2S1M6_9ACTN
MRAVGVKEYGTTPELLDVPKPTPGPGQLLVRVEAAGINPVDSIIAAGVYGKPPLPLVMGVDFAGRVEALGAGVSRYAVGDAVFGRAQGTYAEYVVVDETGPVAAAPDAVELKTSAALPTAGATALGILERAKVRGGESLLLIGAAGGVGTFLTQLASARDVRVVAVTRGDESVRMGLFGAAVTIDATAESVPDRMERDEYPEGVDVLVDLVSSDKAAFAANKKMVHDGGVAVSTRGAVSEHGSVQSGVEEIAFLVEPTAEVLAALAKEVDAGTLKVFVDAEVPLEQAPQAVARIQGGGARGKTIVKL